MAKYGEISEGITLHYGVEQDGAETEGVLVGLKKGFNVRHPKMVRSLKGKEPNLSTKVRSTNEVGVIGL